MINIPLDIYNRFLIFTELEFLQNAEAKNLLKVPSGYIFHQLGFS